MSRYRNLGPDRSGSNAFFDDANLNWEPASVADYAPGPGEASAELNMTIARHGEMTPIHLAEIEVDDGSTSADSSGGELFQQPPSPSPSTRGYAAPPYPYPAAPLADDSSLDRLADLLIARIERKLTGGS